MRSKTVIAISSAKHTLSKSSFFSYLIPVLSAQEAKQYINDMRREHKADHVPFAYHISSVVNEQVHEQSKESDDGEPSHTGGSPLATLLEQHDLTNCVLLVARIFGGVKLGTSNLTKAFRVVGLQAIKQANQGAFIPTSTIDLQVTPSQVGSIEFFANKNELSFSISRDKDGLRCVLHIPLEKKSLISDAQRLLNK